MIDKEESLVQASEYKRWLTDLKAKFGEVK